MLRRAEEAPHDRLSGLTYCFAPSTEPLKLANPANSRHHTNHAKDRLPTFGDIGEAIHYTREQVVRNVEHNNGQDCYHDLFGRSFVPASPLGRGFLLIANLARAVPPRVIDLRQQRLRAIREEERQILFNDISVQASGLAARAIVGFTIERGIDHLSKEQETKYKDAGNPLLRGNIAHGIMVGFVRHAFAPMEDRYQELRDRGDLPTDSFDSVINLAGHYSQAWPDRFAMFDKAFWQKVEDRAA